MYLEGSYNYYIVIISVVISVLASYSSLSITAMISSSKSKVQLFWLFAGSLVMGGGIWSMHFIGMLAIHFHTSVKYNLSFTLLSMLASFISSFIAFYITKEENINRLMLVAGGFIMGSGIVTMHYLGMEAIKMEISYDKMLWILSVVIALCASYAAIFLFIRFRNRPTYSLIKWLSSFIMGFAICGMHYTGMKATKLHNHYGMMRGSDTPVNFYLLYGVIIAIFIILLVSWGAVYFDRHILKKLAYQDNITGLPNRNEMNRFFATNSGSETIGVLYIDLDQFKVINDTLGHNVGDLLIKEVGNRLRRFVQQDQQVFRIGGDEFLFIIKNPSKKRAEKLAVDILQYIKKAYFIEGNELYITVSIGINVSNINKYSERSMLLKAADTALYKAKSLGRNQYCLYDEVMGSEEVRKMELEKDLQRALENNQFFVVYQPKWNVTKNRLVGFEALIRWKHPRLGLISPGEFIPMAEESGAIISMTKWILEEACNQIKLWNLEGMVYPISVNISMRLFQTDTLVEDVQKVLNKTGLDPALLELEITESMVLHDIEDIIHQLKSIRSLGVKVSMDDFGTGYSSIGLLDRLPIDSLKLDRLFTNDLETASKRAIINAILIMAEDLQLDVIAEGVESMDHIEFLTGLGCKIMQGFYYGKPMKSEEINEWFKKNKRN